MSPVHVETLEFVHPDLRHPHVVPGNVPGGQLVRGPRAEDVADSRAGDDDDASPAHPALEAELQVLAAPPLHAFRKRHRGEFEKSLFVEARIIL